MSSNRQNAQQTLQGSCWSWRGGHTWSSHTRAAFLPADRRLLVWVKLWNTHLGTPGPMLYFPGLILDAIRGTCPILSPSDRCCGNNSGLHKMERACCHLYPRNKCERRKRCCAVAYSARSRSVKPICGCSLRCSGSRLFHVLLLWAPFC